MFICLATIVLARIEGWQGEYACGIELAMNKVCKSVGGLKGVEKRALGIQGAPFSIFHPRTQITVDRTLLT
jgi:hypothetical protein